MYIYVYALRFAFIYTQTQCSKHLFSCNVSNAM